MTSEWEEDARQAEYAAAPYGRCILCDAPLTGSEDTEIEGPEGSYWTICAECAAEDATYGAGQTGPAKE
jgi:hypothetical protein